jgi:MFS family permease
LAPTSRGGGIASGDDGRKARRLGARMVVLSWLAYNMTFGLAFGSYGTFVTTFETKFQVTRSVSTLGLPLVLLSLALLAPFVGGLIGRISIRAMMIAGAALSAAGYLLLDFADGMGPVLADYALLIGPGAVLLGALLPSVLVTNWYDTGRGRALGIVNMPLLVGIVPPVSYWMTDHLGIGIVFAVMAAAMLALVPVLFLVVDRPADRGLRPIGAGSAADGEPLAPVPVGYRAIARQPTYWMVALTGCVMSGGAVTMVTHFVAMAVGWGIDPTRAALLVTAVGFMGVVGSPLFGFVADRIGGSSSLALNAALQAAMWLLMLSHPAFPLLLTITAILGTASGGMVPAMNTALSERFGAENIGRTYGLFVFINLPFTVGLPALTGYLFDATGGYTAAFIGIAAALSLVAAMGLALRIAEGRARRAVALPSA